MPGRDAHLSAAARFESFLTKITREPAQQHREWTVVVWFYIALQYVDAFLATKGHLQVTDHPDRAAKMVNYPETRGAVGEAFHQLYKDSKEARYECTEFTAPDLEPIRRRYDIVRNAMRAVLGV